MMIAGVSAIIVLLGAVIAYKAEAYPRRQKAIETLAGTLLVAGFALLGYLLEAYIGRP